MSEPTEDDEQAFIFKWAAMQEKVMPELKFLFSTLNGVRLRPGQAAKAKRLGMKSGVPDIYLDVARGQWHGLRIELKRVKSGRLSPTQKEWLSELKKQNYLGVCVHGGQKAVEVIKTYLRGDGKALLSLIK